jgi:glycosyltransferase involved in cell wall biosynthesis
MATEHTLNAPSPGPANSVSSSALAEYPVVSVVIPCRNERLYIGPCLDSLLACDYPQERFEILVVDGMSDDGTRNVVADFARHHENVKLVDNRSQITPSGMNLGIRRSIGEVIAIVGAHTVFDSQYISECVKHLESYGADEVGGVAIFVPRENTALGRAIAATWSHPFGSGANFAYKRGVREPTWVYTVFSGCFRRSVFERVGLFNEDLKHSQDSEFSRRLAAVGGKILVIPNVKVRYLCRSGLAAFSKHAFRNGVWATLPIAYSDVMPILWVHLIPFVFVSALLGSVIWALWSPHSAWVFYAIAGSYGLAAVASSIQVALKERDPRFCLVLPPIFAILHLGYGFGSLWGLVKALSMPRTWRRAQRWFLDLRRQKRAVDRA